MNNGAEKKSVFRNSIIIRGLRCFGSFIRKSFSESFLHFLLYEKRNRSTGTAAYLIEKLAFTRRVSVPVKRFFSRQTENSFIVGTVKKCAADVKRIQLKTFGAFLFAYGVCCSVAYLIRHVTDKLSALSDIYLTVGIVCAVVGAIFSTSSLTCRDAIGKSRILSFVLFRAIGFDDGGESDRDALNVHGNIAVLLGIVAGLSATLTTPFLIPVGLPLALLGYAVLCVPEAGAVVLLLVFPFVGISVLKYTVLAVTAAWLLKLIRGKRVFSMNTLDISVLCFSALTLLGSGISLTPAESIRAAGDCSLMISCYFIFVNLIRTGKWVKKCAHAAVFSVSAVVTVYVINRILLIFMPSGILYKIFVSLPFFRTVLSMSDVTVVLTIVLLLPMIIGNIPFSRSSDSHFGLLLLFALSAAVTVFVGSRAGVAAGIISALLAVALCGRYAFGKAVLITSLSALIIAVLPYGISDKIFSFFTVPERTRNLIRSAGIGTANMLSDCIGGGIGIGDHAFRSAYPLYSACSADTPPNTYNLYTQIAVSLGLAAFLLFALTVILFVRHYFSYRSESVYGSDGVGYTAAAAFSGIAGFLVYGMFGYVWSDLRVFALFWTVLGLSSAAVRTGIREKISVPLPDGPYIEFRI